MDWILHLCSKRDDILADVAIEYLKRNHDKSFLLSVSFDNPYNVCEWARSHELPW